MVVTWFPLHMHSSLKDRGQGSETGRGAQWKEGRKEKWRRWWWGGVGIKGNGRKEKERKALLLSLSQVKDLINMGAWSQLAPQHHHHTSLMPPPQPPTQTHWSLLQGTPRSQTTHKHSLWESLDGLNTGSHETHLDVLSVGLHALMLLWQ